MCGNVSGAPRDFVSDADCGITENGSVILLRSMNLKIDDSTLCNPLERRCGCGASLVHWYDVNG